MSNYFPAKYVNNGGTEREAEKRDNFLVVGKYVQLKSRDWQKQCTAHGGAEGIGSHGGTLGSHPVNFIVRRGGMDVPARWTGHEIAAPPASVEPVHGERSVETS